MSFLTATAQITHTSRLPRGTTRAQALAMLSDYEFFISCDPHMSKYELLPPDEAQPPAVPDRVKAQLRSASSSEPVPVCYRVTDIVHAVPAGLWDTNVVSTYEFVDMVDGVFVRIRSPLSTVMETFWEVQAVEGGEEGELELVEEATIRCSRLLIGVVKGQCENGWAKIHAKMVERLAGEVKE